jgi:phosphoribosylformylglycinamidine (FGAM) synthase PurS component
MEKIDLTLLPGEARRELIDFYEFLLEKYGSRKEKNDMEDIKETLLINKVQIDTKNWKFSREEIYEG